MLSFRDGLYPVFSQVPPMQVRKQTSRTNETRLAAGFLRANSATQTTIVILHFWSAMVQEVLQADWQEVGGAKAAAAFGGRFLPKFAFVKGFLRVSFSFLLTFEKIIFSFCFALTPRIPPIIADTIKIANFVRLCRPEPAW